MIINLSLLWCHKLGYTIAKKERKIAARRKSKCTPLGKVGRWVIFKKIYNKWKVLIIESIFCWITFFVSNGTIFKMRLKRSPLKWIGSNVCADDNKWESESLDWWWWKPLTSLFCTYLTVSFCHLGYNHLLACPPFHFYVSSSPENTKVLSFCLIY